MLTEERRNGIEKLVNTQGSVTLQELLERFDASESTLRRDLTEMDARGLLVKVHGGAMAKNAPEGRTVTADLAVLEREQAHREEKQAIARYAASLISDQDLIYLDAGTTTGYMIDYLPERGGAIFVTDGLTHARKLAAKGYRVLIPGGQYKPATEAVVGEEAILNLSKYHFTKGFFGTNAVTKAAGFSTPDPSEAMVKRRALSASSARYVLCDASKFGLVSYVTFFPFSDALILTAGDVPELYRKCENVKVIEEVISSPSIL